jgi:hypothetical protein
MGTDGDFGLSPSNKDNAIPLTVVARHPPQTKKRAKPPKKSALLFSI